MPGERRKWIVLLVLFWTFFSAAGALGSYGVFFNPLLGYLKISRAKLAVLPTIVMVLAYVIAPGVGWLLDRISGRWVVGTGLFLVGAGLLLSASAHSYGFLVVASVVFALSFGLSSGVSGGGTLISHWFLTGRALAMGIAFAGYGLGSSALLQLAGYIIRHFGWRWAYVVISVPAFLLVPAAILVLSNPPWEEGIGTREGGGPDLPGLEVNEGIAGRSFWLISASMFIFSFEASILIVHSVAQLIALKLNPVSAVTAVSMGFLLSAFFKPSFGALAEKFGCRRALAFCLTGSAMCCLTVIRGNVMPFTALFVVGFAFSQVGIVLYPALAAETYGVRRYGTLWGLNTAITVAGQLLGPMLAGASFDRYASYAPIFVLCAALTLISVLLPFGCVPFAAPERRPTNLAQASAN